jgi:hypothetical protein
MQVVSCEPRSTFLEIFFIKNFFLFNLRVASLGVLTVRGRALELNGACKPENRRQIIGHIILQEASIETSR